MKIQYANEFVQNLGMGNPTTCVYLFFNNKNYNDDTKIRQYFIMHGMVLCIKVDIYMSHIIYAYPFSHNTEVPISIKNNKIILSLDTYTTVFSWGSGNSNQYRT